MNTYIFSLTIRYEVVSIAIIHVISFARSLTLFRIVLGDFNFPLMQAINPVLGPIVLVTYVFFVFFVLLNMFLAIINDTYGQVKADMNKKKSELEIAQFFKQVLSTV